MNKFYFRRMHLALLSLSTIILAFVFGLPAADTSSSLPAPPVAKKEPKVTEINGQKLVDNYFWLRDKKNPNVKAYLDAENVYTDAVMKPTEPLQKKLYDEMLSRIKETAVEVPYQDGDYFYYVRTEAGKQYGIRCRKKASMDTPEEILLDVNELAKGQTFMSLGAYNVSDDGNLLAYSADNTGYRQFTLAVKDLRSGKLLIDHAERVDSMAWANDNKTIFYTVEDAVSNPGSKNWQEVVAQRSDVMLDDIDFYKRFYVLFEREKGLPQIRVTDLQTGKSKHIEFPEPAYTVYAGANREYDTTKFRYRYQSFITPPSVFDYDVVRASSTLLKEWEIPGGYDRTRYQVERIFATASDGVKIPVSVAHLKGAKLDGKGPIYLTGYGSYGAPYDISFDSPIFSMVDRGVVVAVAHIRGGGEMGKAWHDDGRMMHKQNTFTDFIASAEYLLAQGYGSKDRLVIEGRSAGGLLMGAVLNMRPDLFHAALVGVPFVDVMNTMLDESLPLTVSEFEEWGNPKEKPAFDYMITYSPYDNIEAKTYPNMLVRTSFNDSQVMYWEPAKYVAKMRALRTDHNTLILKTNMDPAGHGGASGRYERLHETAFDYAYFLAQMGIQN